MQHVDETSLFHQLDIRITLIEFNHFTQLRQASHWWNFTTSLTLYMHHVIKSQNFFHFLNAWRWWNFTISPTLHTHHVDDILQFIHASGWWSHRFTHLMHASSLCNLTISPTFKCITLMTSHNFTHLTHASLWWLSALFIITRFLWSSQ